VLNEIRHGYCSEEAQNILESCKNNKLDSYPGIEPTRLYPHNMVIIIISNYNSHHYLHKDVDKINMERLSNIAGKGKLFRAKDKGKDPFLELLQSNCPGIPMIIKVVE
jgi:hypothetical protein